MNEYEVAISFISIPVGPYPLFIFQRTNFHLSHNIKAGKNEKYEQEACEKGFSSRHDHCDVVSF